MFRGLKCLQDETLGASGTVNLDDDNADCKALCDNTEGCEGFIAHTSNGKCWTKPTGCYDDLQEQDIPGVVTYGTYIKMGEEKKNPSCQIVFLLLFFFPHKFRILMMFSCL